MGRRYTAKKEKEEKAKKEMEEKAKKEKEEAEAASERIRLLSLPAIGTSLLLTSDFAVW